jgi:hypothetical protein
MARIMLPYLQWGQTPFDRSVGVRPLSTVVAYTLDEHKKGV